MESLPPGTKVRVNSAGDLMMDWDAKSHIGKDGEVLRQQKDGCYQVRTSVGTIVLPKRNLDLVDG